MGIGQLLLSYWWIILLLVLLLAVLTRKIIKFVISTLVLFVVLFILLWIADLIISPSLKGLSDCYKTANQEQQLMNNRMQKEQWGKQKYCEEDKAGLLSLSACYERVESESPVSIETIETMVNSIKPGLNLYLSAFIQEHNTECAEYPDTLIE
jgi:hypothetical protein